MMIERGGYGILYTYGWLLLFISCFQNFYQSRVHEHSNVRAAAQDSGGNCSSRATLSHERKPGTVTRGDARRNRILVLLSGSNQWLITSRILKARGSVFKTGHSWGVRAETAKDDRVVLVRQTFWSPLIMCRRGERSNLKLSAVTS